MVFVEVDKIVWGDSSDLDTSFICPTWKRNKIQLLNISLQKN